MHGWGSNFQRWQKVKELLEKEKIEVLVPELPGFGKTSPPEEPWNIDNYVDWAIDFTQKYNWEKFNLLGHSFGGGLAVKIAAKYPEKIEKLILCAPAVIREKRKKVLSIEKTAKVGKKIFEKIKREDILEFFGKVFGKLLFSFDYYKAKGPMKETFKKIVSEDLKDNLKKIKVPTLILWGGKDHMVPLRYAERIKKEIDNAKLIIFSGARHGVNLEIPDKLAKEILSFLI